MKLISIVLLFALFVPHSSNSCTIFRKQLGKDLFVAKNHDWDVPTFPHLMVNPRNLKKKGIITALGRRKRWVSKYGSLTINSEGVELPVGGLNEKGLSIDMLWLEPSRPAKKLFSPYLNEFQWLQYHLDMFATVEEVITSAKKIRLKEFAASIHYFVCDQSAQCAVIENLKEKLVVTRFDQNQMAMITNSTVEKSYSKLESYQGFGGEKTLPKGDASLSRFIRMAHFLKTNPEAINGFDMLSAAAMEEEVEEGSTWQLMYHHQKQMVQFRTQGNQGIQTVSLKDVDFSCQSSRKVLDMRVERFGEVSNDLILLSDEINERIMRKSLEQNSDLFDPPEFYVRYLLGFSKKFKCLQ